MINTSSLSTCQPDESVLIIKDNKIQNANKNINKFIDKESADILDKNPFDVLPYGLEIKNKFFDKDYSNFKRFINEYLNGDIIMKLYDEYLIKTKNTNGKDSIFYPEIQSMSPDNLNDNYIITLKRFCRNKYNFRDLIAHNSDIMATVDDEINIYTIGSGNLDIEMDNPQNPNNILECVHDKDVTVLKKNIDEVLNQEESTNSTTCRIKNDKGVWKMYNVRIHNSNYYDEVNMPILSFEDVSDEYYFEQRRRVINRVLRHDLRNDMNVVIGHAQILEEIDNWKVQKHASKIKNKSQKLIKLGEEVRAIDQELGRINRRIKNVNLRTEIENVMNKIHKEYPKVTFINETKDHKVIGNELLRTGIRHAIHNAIVHNDNDDKVVKLKTSVENDHIILKIIDNGQGIVKSERDVINTGIETKLDHISGLGLWMMKWIASSVDGNLKIYNNEDDDIGTVVEMRFKSSSEFSIDDIKNGDQKWILDSNEIGINTGNEIGTNTRSQK